MQYFFIYIIIYKPSVSPYKFLVNTIKYKIKKN
jgi:hypothetical protein